VSYKKLVRDKIPEIIRKNGKEPVTRVLDEKEYLVELVKKLKEEVAEFEADHSVEELADIKEVIIAIREVLNIRAGELEDVRRAKAAKNGRFKNRIYLEEVKE
jgi:predicted house-cleaning noncanonical NTP pyrophosphatase (MazG superfamily)